VIVNPFTLEGKNELAPIPGTHIVESTLGILGSTFYDVHHDDRVWSVYSLYTPVIGRAIGGVRAKVVDNKGFISFCNQRDLEVLLQMATPGSYCEWLDQDYVDTNDRDWVGLAVDDDDLLDDLYDRELEARARYPAGSMLEPGLSFERLIHNGRGNDFAENMLLLNDIDLRTGMGPDLNMATIETRWVSIERTAPRERARLWRKR